LKTLQYLRYALRLLARSPGFAATIILTLALGIGAATTVFSVTESILWKPLAFKDSERLVTIFSRSPNLRQDGLVSGPDFLEWQANARSLGSMAAYGGGESHSVTGGAEVLRVPIDTISTNFFSTVGLTISGRDFLPGESAPGRNHVAIVSAQFWNRQFPGAPPSAPRTIRLDDVPFEIVGVLPPGVHLENFGLHEVLIPLYLNSNLLQQRDSRTLEVLGRLKDDVSIKQAQLELNAICRRLSLAYPSTNLNWGANVESLRESIVSVSYRTTLRTFVGASALLLLAACVNAAGLLLARASNRTREFAVRSTLGAGHWSLIQQWLSESLFLGIVAGCLGITLAWFGTRSFILLAASSAVDVPRLSEISLDFRAVAFSAAISLLVVLAMGLVPAVVEARADLGHLLQGASRTATAGRQHQRLRSLFVVIQFSLATVLLVAAGLFTRSLVHLQHLDPGFSPQGVLSGSVSLSGSRYSDAAHITAFSRALEEQVRNTPGSLGAALATRLPLIGGYDVRIAPAERPNSQPGAEPSVLYSSVTPGYFDVLRIPLLRGRAFTASDDAASDRVAVINENFASQYFSGLDPVGRHLRIPGPASPGEPQPGLVRIVGVTANAHAVGLDEVAFAEIYFPLAQEPARDLYLAMLTGPGAPAAESLLRNAVSVLDRDAPVSDVKSMEARVAESLGENRFNMILIAITATMAVVLAALGTYGVISFNVARRTREIGIRTALGAQKGRVVQMVLAQGATLAAIGLTTGLTIALGLGRLFSADLYLAPQLHSGLLYGVSTHDPATFAAVILVLTASALLGCCAPALRAARVDPVIALRYE
jgi:putative ABC transport system permease protein